jgi:hypothetical protein
MRKNYHHHGGPSSLADAKARLNIHQLWTHFGFDGTPKASCRSPFRDDHKASFSVTADGGLFHDFSTDEGGDAVDFLQRATGLSKKEACRKFIELAGGRYSPSTFTTPARPVRVAPSREKPSFPEFHKGSVEEITTLARLRNISIEGLNLASERGLLFFATVKNCPAWVVADAARVNAQARRLDGEPWDHLQGAKSYTLPGSWAAWPVGIMESEHFPSIALCEGGPDSLAAHHFMLAESRSDCAAVGILGASQRIHAEALPMFTGKRVRIFGHDDDAGRKAVDVWAKQLATVGADVDAFTFAGLRKADETAIKDWNDCTSVHPDDFEAERSLWNLLP